MYLATSKSEATSKRFSRRASLEYNIPPVIWVIDLDREYKCFHVNYVDNTLVKGEDEFLFVPYSVFTVVSVEWKEKPSWMEPHVVRLRAAIDNLLHPEDLPLSKWN